MALKKLDQNDHAEITRLFSQAPDWVNFISFDDDGHQSWFEAEPEISNGEYWLDGTETIQEDCPFDGLHFENQTYCSCCIERPRFKTKCFSHPNNVVRDIFNGLRNWRQSQKNIKAKEAADEIKRLINWGK